MFSPLKVDGDVGPKTRQATRTVLAALPSGTAEEGMALGQFEKIASGAKTTKLAPETLKAETSDIFGSLFRASEEATPKATHEGLGLQATINDIGTKSFGDNSFKPIKEDGIVGPKTADAFGDIMKLTTPSDFTSSMADNMGFFSFT